MVMVRLVLELRFGRQSRRTGMPIPQPTGWTLPVAVVYTQPLSLHSFQSDVGGVWFCNSATWPPIFTLVVFYRFGCIQQKLKPANFVCRRVETA